ncbi:ABC transporter permease subunit [Geobacter hydrogenophilus]|uniref:Sulfonate ABC transporter permease n=1 Tax=Geobacter hydrogenophilus TaxID=40983 RepID=A0A9W6G2V1_9BACT|nr:ABC transporter permease subunit [Geobacter hydrogenophilus]MBT0894413.1 ABC transporter permease subunit [Geobacter hydrogenophilus]GLI39431.1 sulfonate ABC transporter permease [Geobacter hydrogenophilus]
MISGFIKKYGRSIVLLAVLVLLFELATDLTGWLEPVLFPGLSKILPELKRSSPKLALGFLNSMGLLLPSYLLALVLGIGGGLLVGSSATLRAMLMPIFRGVSPIPPTMLIPYAIAVLPTFWLSSAFIIFAGAFWPILMGTIHGVVLLDARYLDNASTLGLRGFRLLRKVVFPGALPMIFSGAGMALVFSFILLTVAEMFGAKSGMGHFIQYYADFSDYPKVLAGMIFMSLVIILIMELFDLVQRRALHWIGKR